MVDIPLAINVFQASKSVCTVIKINLHTFYVFLMLAYSIFTGVLHCKWILTFRILIFVTVLLVSVTNSKALQYMTPTNRCPMYLYALNIRKSRKTQKNFKKLKVRYNF